MVDIDYETFDDLSVLCAEIRDIRDGDYSDMFLDAVYPALIDKLKHLLEKVKVI